MNAYLDERFPTLAAVTELVDGEAARIEALKQSRRAYAAQLATEARARRAQQREHTARRVRAAIDRDGSDGVVAPRVAAQIDELRRLRTRQRVLELARDAAAYLRDADANAVNLATVATSLRALAPRDELALAVHDDVLARWWQPRMDARCAELRAVLRAADWPRADPPRGSATVQQALQRCLAFELDASGPMQTFDVLAEPLAERIAFHFRQGQDTAREDRPEWLFAYVLRLIEPHTAWLAADVQRHVDMPVERLVRALSPAVVRALRATYVVDAHFVDELLQFAAAVEARLWVARATVDACIVAPVLDEPTLVAYLRSEHRERQRALDRIHAADSGFHTTDFDADVPCAKPPFSAENAWQLVAQAVPLLPLGPPLVASIIQVPLVDSVLAFWDASLDAFTKSHSSLARAVGGAAAAGGLDADRRATLPELPDMEYLAQVFGATAYFEVNLKTLASQLAVPLQSWPMQDHLAQFGRLRAQAAARLAGLLGLEAQKQLKPYLRVEWSDPDDHTHRLRAGIEGLGPRLAAVARLCSASRADRARVFVDFANSLAEIIWRVVINANVFTPASAAALHTDLVELWSKWSLPATQSHARNLAATRVLETGDEQTELTAAEADGLRRRRK